MNKASNFTLEDYVRILNQYQELQQENTHLKEAIKRCYTPEEIDFEIMPVKAELQAEKDINNNLHKTIDKLRVNLYETQQENRQLKDRIEKVMKYLDDNRDTCYMDEDITYLLKILKGEENE